MKITKKRVWWGIGIAFFILWSISVLILIFPEDPEWKELLARVSLLREEALLLLEENQKLFRELEEEEAKVFQEAAEEMKKIEKALKEKKLRVLEKKELMIEQECLEKLLPILRKYNVRLRDCKEKIESKEKREMEIKWI